MTSLRLDLYIWRATYRMTQRAAADVIGVSPKTYARWERGETAPDGEYLERVRWALAHPAAGWARVDGEAPF